MSIPETQAQMSQAAGPVDAVPVAEAVVPEQRPAAEAAVPERPVTTPGGLPGVPLLTIGTSSTVAAVSAAGLVAGPVPALMAAGSLAVTAAVAVVARTRSDRLAGGRSAGAAVRSGTASARSASPAGRSNAAGRFGRSASPVSQAKGRGGASGGRVGQIRTARAVMAGSPMSRRQRRIGQADARRGRAEARRTARAEARQSAPERRLGAGGAKGAATGSTGRQAPSRGAHAAPKNGLLSRAGRAVPGLGARRGQAGPAGGAPGPVKPGSASAPARTGSARQQRRQLKREARWQARDAARDRRVAAARDRIGQRAAGRARKSALRRSAARFQARRAGAGLAAMPAGLAALLCWPVAWLMKTAAPRWGRQVYRRLVEAARAARAEQDQAVNAEHDQEQAEAALAGRSPLPDPDRVAPTAAPVPNTPMKETPMSNPNAFDFRAAAEEMLRQAQTAEPGGMMNVLASFESLPETLGLLAETFAVVASRASDDMPLDPAVGDALGDVNKVLLSAVEAGAEVSRVFSEKHEQEIARHTDPRPGEEGWDTTANQDYQGYQG
ncbi:hypothetical protein [Streptomyces sp. NPDC048603]|uniref:hypothetical protein n=1 Tax=Streptomyces sp. NPDC048603 TaxID=3365577 RepID=UPI003715AEC0